MGKGTNWGGYRPGSGRKKKTLAEHMQSGTDATVIRFPETPEEAELPEVKDYLDAEQRLGELHAKEIYEETWQWLKERGCLNLVNPHLIEQYSMSMGRWVQLESLQSQIGPISKQINGEMKVSPIVTMAQNYLREARALWNEIWYIVQSNCSEPFSGSPMDDEMERLLRE